MGKILKYIDGNMVEYEILKLVDQYDPILRTKTTLFDFKNPQMSPGYIAYSLAETLSKLEGLGLSANQVGLPYRVCAINMGDKIWIMFNPEIIETSFEVSEYNEGCLSFPGLYLKLKRPKSVKVKFQALAGDEVVQQFDGLTATCVQHEIDHLDGICYTDKISPIKLDMAKRKVKTNLKKLERIKNGQYQTQSISS